MNARKFQPFVWVTVVALVLSGCATIMHGINQDIGISSSPSGAIVTIDNRVHGETPIIASLARKRNHFIKIELPGYKPFQTTITKSTSGWVFGNIIIGGLIGLGIDAVSGGLYELGPEQVFAQLREDKSSFLNEDILLIKVAKVVNPEWTKIGQMEKK